MPSPVESLIQGRTTIDNRRACHYFGESLTDNFSEESTMSLLSKRGFASMSPEKQREIASMGGIAAHEQGRAHEFTPEEAQKAGRRGGQVVSSDREHMSRIGRKGGESRANNRSRSKPRQLPAE
jgi:uncharacterized protein